MAAQEVEFRTAVFAQKKESASPMDQQTLFRSLACCLEHCVAKPDDGFDHKIRTEAEQYIKSVKFSVHHDEPFLFTCLL